MDSARCMAILQKMSFPQTMDEDDFEFYASRLREYGWPQVYEALQKLRESMTRRPSITEIKSAMGLAKPLSAEQTIDLQAKLLIGKIKDCFGPCGYTDPKGARERIGEVGWAALGGTRGWIELCHSPDTEIRLAQIREIAKALMLLPPEKQQGRLCPPEAPAIDHAQARAEAAKRELDNARRMLRLIIDDAPTNHRCMNKSTFENGKRREGHL